MMPLNTTPRMRSRIQPTHLGLQLLHELRLPLLTLLVGSELTPVSRLLLVQPPPQIHVLLRHTAGLG